MANSMNLPTDAGSSPSPISRFLGGSSAISHLAHLTGFQRREPRKITPSVFLQAFVHAALQPTGSIRGIAIRAGIPETTGAALECLPQGIGRVLVADSALMALHPSLAEYFPDASNQAGVRQASARVQAVLDLPTGHFIDFQIGSSRDNDQKAASWTTRLVRAGDLILRDLGYFTIGSLRTIAARGAYFITRLRLDTAL